MTHQAHKCVLPLGWQPSHAVSLPLQQIEDRELRQEFPIYPYVFLWGKEYSQPGKGVDRHTCRTDIHTCPTCMARTIARLHSTTAPQHLRACWWLWTGGMARPTHGSYHRQKRWTEAEKPGPYLPRGTPLPCLALLLG